MIEKPMVSVIVPVYNAGKYLEESISCIEKQTMSDLEIICVDDCSSDGSLEILYKHADRDARIRVLRQEKNGGAGKARNTGMAAARGKYLYFFDADDLCEERLLEKTVAEAEKYSADIVAFHFKRLLEDGSFVPCNGIHTEYIPSNKDYFNYEDCPDRILSVVNPTPWNKLYRTEFVRDSGLRWEEISSSNDITFSALSVAKANRVVPLSEQLFIYRVGHPGTITSAKSKNMNNIILAVESVIRQAMALSYAEVIKNAIVRFAIDNYLYGINFILQREELFSEESKAYYAYVHEAFRKEMYAEVDLPMLGNDLLFLKFSAVRERSYEELCGLQHRRMIVSFTSYPARIQEGAAEIVENIWKQSRLPDKVVLYLAMEEFPRREADLPEKLVERMSEGKVEIHWCDANLKPHKKYFYAFQEYPEDIIVTIDDDLVYGRSMLEKLYWSYLLHPEAISAMRVHFILFEADGSIAPYRLWIKETNGILHTPSMQLLATGGAGTLYPPHLLSQDLLIADTIREIAPTADDLWLKCMEVYSGIPVVLASDDSSLKYIDDTQDNALWLENTTQNDLQLQRILQWYSLNCPGTSMREDMFEAKEPEKTLYAIDMNTYLKNIIERERYRQSIHQGKLRRAWREKTELSIKLKSTYREKSEINAKLKQTYQEKAERGIQIKELQKRVQGQQKMIDDQTKALRVQGTELHKLQEELRELKQSNSWRIGRAITWPIRKCKKFWGSIFMKKD